MVCSGRWCGKGKATRGTACPSTPGLLSRCQLYNHLTSAVSSIHAQVAYISLFFPFANYMTASPSGS